MRQKLVILMALSLCILATSCTKSNAQKETMQPTTQPTVQPTLKPTEKPKITEAVATEAPKPENNYLQYKFDANTKFQTVDGFGGAYTWYADMALRATDPSGLFDTLFSDAKLTILRFKNEYEYNGMGSASNVNTMLNIYNQAKERAAKYGEDVIVLLSCWSPPRFLKENNDITGKATLIKDKKGNYEYDEYGAWWAESVNYYESKGIKIDYVSIQNEADFAASYDGCRFDAMESDKVASYSKAYLATYHALQKTMGKDAPAMMGPETMSCIPETLYQYMKDVIDTAPESIYGIAHHLYVGGTGDEKADTISPDSWMMNFLRYKNYFKDYKLWQTEYYIGHALDTATLINNCMTIENANAYLYWSNIWIGNDSPLFESGFLIGVTGRDWATKADYYAMRHFSEFIRPGFTRISATSGDMDIRTSAYISKDGSKLAIVLINRKKDAATLQLNGTGYTIKDSTIYQSVVGATCESADNLYQNIGSLGKDNTITLPAESITTIDISGSTE